MPIMFAAVLFLLVTLLGCSTATTSIQADGPERQDAGSSDGVVTDEPRATIPSYDSMAFTASGTMSDPSRVTIPPAALIGDPPAAIALRRSGRQILVDVHIGESDPYSFLFDTGAQYTTIDPQLAEKFPDLVVEHETPTRMAPGPDGTVLTTNRSMRLPKVRIADVHMENVIALVYDHAHVSSSADEVVFGIVGIGHFRNVPTRLNLSEGFFEVGVDTSDLDPDSFGVVPLEIVYSMPFTDVSFEDHFVRCLIDSGANGGFNIPTEVFDKLVSDDQAYVSEGASVPFSGKPFTTRVLDREVDAFLGPYRMATSPNFEFPMDFGEYSTEFGLIGRKVLEHFVITFDPEAGLVRFELVDPADCD